MNILQRGLIRLDYIIHAGLPNNGCWYTRRLRTFQLLKTKILMTQKSQYGDEGLEDTQHAINLHNVGRSNNVGSFVVRRCQKWRQQQSKCSHQQVVRMNRKRQEIFHLDLLISGPLPEHAIPSKGGFSPTHLVLPTYHSTSLRDLNRSMPWLIPDPIKLTANLTTMPMHFIITKKQCIKERHIQFC